MVQLVFEFSFGFIKVVIFWLIDQIVFVYWRFNFQILSCNKCVMFFKDNDIKYYCCVCGEGFCDGCLLKIWLVFEWGWGFVLVWVCDNCYEVRNVQLVIIEVQVDDEGGIFIVWKVGEVVQNILGVVVMVIDILLGLVKDVVRFVYWVFDYEILYCYNCWKEFSIKFFKYYCWVCGQGFCDECFYDCWVVFFCGWDYFV